MSQFDVRAQIRVKRVDSERIKNLPATETTGWIALGLVVALIYLTTKTLIGLEASTAKPGSNEIYLPEPLNVNGKIKLPAQTPQEFTVKPDKRLVVSWRNPYQCDQEVLLSYRPSDNSEGALKTEVLAGLSGNKIFPLLGETNWQVQWQVRDKNKREQGCRNANYGSMPENIEVFGFQEAIPTFAPPKK